MANPLPKPKKSPGRPRKEFVKNKYGISPVEAAEELLRRRKARKGLLEFTQYTKRDYVVARHHQLIAQYLEAVERGEIKRLMIFMPPRHGKSELVSRRFPAWYLGRNPNKQVIAASYNSDLAMTFGREVRNLIADSLYQNVFPGVTLRQDSKAADRWNTVNGGYYLSAGVGTGITGHGADIGIIDDPFKDRKEAASQTIRENTWNWYISAFFTRLMPGAAVVLTLTRWHEDGLEGRLLKQMLAGGEQWVVLSLPAIATGPDLMGRNEGEALWPEWYSIDTLHNIKNTIGSYEFAALYQQSPEVDTGNIFQRHWWQFYREVPAKYDFVLQSWDTAFEAGQENDYSVCTTWGVDGGKIHLIDRWKDRVEFPELKRAFLALAVRHKPDCILVEKKASGQSILQELQRDSLYPVVPFTPDRNKEARAHAVTAMIEGGRVYLPEWGSWVGDYMGCMAVFPSGAHDDDVDSTTQALMYLKNMAFEVFDQSEVYQAEDVRQDLGEGQDTITGY